MASNDRKKKKERFVGIPYYVVISEPWARLKAPEVKLLVDLLMQYSGRNNGMLSPSYTLMKERGWAKSSLYRAYVALVYHGFIVVTREGWKQRGCPTLVAITFYGIDESKKLEYDKEIKPNPVPLAYWKKSQSNWKHQPKLKPPS